MFYISEREYKQRLKKVEEYNKSLERKEALKNAKRKRKINLPTTTKLITFYLFIVLNIVLIYSLLAMWHFANLSYLGTVITTIVGQILVYLIYAAKSSKENSVGGIKYETTMAQIKNNKVKYTANDDAVG